MNIDGPWAQFGWLPNEEIPYYTIKLHFIEKKYYINMFA
jgi:hypothetical protein